jgi:hypothetical protein
MTRRLHTEPVQAKAIRVFIKIYPLFRSEWLSTNILLTLHKALIMSAMTYAYPVWEFVAETRTLNLQWLQNKILRTTRHFPMGTLVCDRQMALHISYIYD